MQQIFRLETFDGWTGCWKRQDTTLCFEISESHEYFMYILGPRLQINSISGQESLWISVFDKTLKITMETVWALVQLCAHQKWVVLNTMAIISVRTFETISAYEVESLSRRKMKHKLQRVIDHLKYPAFQIPNWNISWFVRLSWAFDGRWLFVEFRIFDLVLGLLCTVIARELSLLDMPSTHLKDTRDVWSSFYRESSRSSSHGNGAPYP